MKTNKRISDDAVRRSANNFIDVRLIRDEIVSDIFRPMHISYPMQGFRLRHHRITLGATRKDFAKMCGWPVSFQRKIEESARDTRYMSCFQRDKIVAALLMLCEMQENKNVD